MTDADRIERLKATIDWARLALGEVETNLGNAARSIEIARAAIAQLGHCLDPDPVGGNPKIANAWLSGDDDEDVSGSLVARGEENAPEASRSGKNPAESILVRSVTCGKLSHLVTKSGYVLSMCGQCISLEFQRCTVFVGHEIESISCPVCREKWGEKRGRNGGEL